MVCLLLYTIMKDKPEATKPEAETTASDNAAEETVEHAQEVAAEDVTELLAQLDKIQQEAQTAQERALRAVADLDNYRRRAAREMEENRRRANAALIEALLPALDNFQLGLDAAAKHPEAADVTKGFEVVASQLTQILGEYGLEIVAPQPGEDFDHNAHEAVSQMPSDEVPDHKILTLVRPGFKLNEHLLRPASVVVSSGPAA